jgi:hypothetical protein
VSAVLLTARPVPVPVPEPGPADPALAVGPQEVRDTSVRS